MGTGPQGQSPRLTDAAYEPKQAIPEANCEQNRVCVN
jgi:hypothetical protein